MLPAAPPQPPRASREPAAAVMAAEEPEVDVEGDPAAAPGEGEPGEHESTASSLLQDHYLDSSWRADNNLPWTLDSSISEENRAVIEKMLLEEEYYLSNKSLSEKIWLNQKEAEKRSMKSPHKKTGKVMVRSPTKSTSYSVKWTSEEKELFEQGLVKFGRRWTKIAKLIGSRTVLQVKSYARQYFKNKAKNDESEREEQNQCGSSLPSEDGIRVEAWSSGNLRGRADPNLNAVKIEKLSDDEEVDITDDTDELFSPTFQQDAGKPELSVISRSPVEETKGMEHVFPSVGHSSAISLSKEDSQHTKQDTADVLLFRGVAATCSQHRNGDKSVNLDYQQCNNFIEKAEQGRTETSHGSKQVADQELNEEQRDLADNGLLFHSPCQADEDHQEEAEELKPPDQEVEIDRSIILEEEKQAIPEFFEGRQAKTPERYLKIRNYILDQWERCKPKYLNKTSVRPGLKNCGDVNCIGRIHTYLELIGAINFGCEQAVYNRPQPADKTRSKEGKDTVEAYQLAQRLQSMRTRRRRVRDPWGNWCDAKDLEGQTFEHLSAEELARRREEEKLKPAKSSKGSRQIKSSFDPFQLIPCCLFTEEKQEPFQVKVSSEALLIMDLHSHVSMAEVIGLLGGRYSEADKIVEVCAAEPCNSLSTGLQCEMDPVSQTQASETLAARGYSVIGWYHSHPAFDPNPSIRDIDTQAKYQSYFSRGGAMFIGMIISPYNRNNPLPYSQMTCLVISDEISSDGSYRLPYKFEVQQMSEEPQWELIFEKTRWIIEKYKFCHSSVPMDKIFHRDSDLTCLQKLLECMRRTLDKVTNCFIAEEFLTQIENLFLSTYKSEKKSNAEENKNECSNESPM
uniref:Myb-like, SWIRM and MPN domain-containing protein 1 n=2 Tax=Anas TaxID=8835 RepID=U3IEN0_ANAPP|nr:histone H2A deubiquitinase MYSM1 isoform X1 [Anas platyrhynchos]|eukprot:XP_027318472.1 histone H2A deubiquitinase MYSM1 isoform X1 [Anas platyrhynchos]